eukprot:9829587-Lingulodinium_polyedra.AAC.1
MLCPGFDASASGKDSEALVLLEWVCSAASGQHDCHNALKWSLHRYVNDADLMSDTYIVIAASVRNAYGLLHEHLAGWLQARLVFAPEADLPPPEER